MVLVPVDAWQLNAATRANQKSLWLRPFYEAQLRFVRQFIQRYYSNYDQVILVSDEDAQATRLLSPGLNVVVQGSTSAASSSPRVIAWSSLACLPDDPRKMRGLFMRDS